MNCPYCNQPLSHEIYRMKPGQLQYILFCENEDCPVKPCTDATAPSKAIKEIESMRMKMNKEEYITQNQTSNYLFTEQYSEPKYDCPECDNGHMRKNLMMVLASYPPKYQYECDTCGHINYLDF